MQYPELIERIRQRAGLASSEDAEKITFAILGTLGERLYRTEERQFAAQLPKELKNAFYEFQPRERARADVGNFNLEEFYNRVKARADLTFQEAQRQSKIVMRVLQEAVSAGEIEEVRTELPPEFAELFDGQPEVRHR